MGDNIPASYEIHPSSVCFSNWAFLSSALQIKESRNTEAKWTGAPLRAARVSCLIPESDIRVPQQPIFALSYGIILNWGAMFSCTFMRHLLKSATWLQIKDNSLEAFSHFLWVLWEKSRKAGGVDDSPDDLVIQAWPTV